MSKNIKELKDLLGDINKKMSKGSKDSKPMIVFGSEIKESLKPTFLSTGIPVLDEQLGGGYPRGATTTLWGEKGCGKTSLALMAVAQTQKEGGQAVWIDAEPPFPYLTAMLLGVNLDDLIIIRPKDYGEQILDVVKELLFDSENRVTRGVVDLVICDSINGLVPKARITATEDKGSEAHTMGRRAAMLSQWLEELSGRALLRENTVFLPIAQARVDIAAYGAPLKMSGGQALEFLSKVITKVTKRRIEGGDPMKGHEVAFRIEKNNVIGRPGEGSYQVMYGIGVNDAEAVIAEALEKGLIQKVKGKVYNIHLPEEILEVDSGIGGVRSTITNDATLKNRIKQAIADGFNPGGEDDTDADTEETES